MPEINLNWFLGVLSVELWVVSYLIVFWSEVVGAWHAWWFKRRRRARQAGRFDVALYQAGRAARSS